MSKQEDAIKRNKAIRSTNLKRVAWISILAVVIVPFALRPLVANWLGWYWQPPPVVKDYGDGFKVWRAVPPQPPITQFAIHPVNQARKDLNPSELVLGATINGESRAYPINMLTGPHREILNDFLGGQPIAATW